MFKQELLILKYNKDVLCVADKDEYPVCKAVPSAKRRNNMNPTEPSHDPYIPRLHSIFYNCTTLSCEPLKLTSLTQITNPKLHLKSCFLFSLEKFDCEDLKFNNFKNEDKLVFLRNNIHNKTFYLVNCLVYADTGRVCHRTDAKDSHNKLVDIATLVRPKEEHILSEEEFLCEETETKQVNCDLNPFVPYRDGLKVKESVKIQSEILLKTGSYAVMLNRSCIDDWCGFTGSVAQVAPTRRFERYDPPGGKVFRCYYAKHQQVCACGALAALDGYSPQQDPDQFHIQTDEDDERYFLYQTHNGQYRKERRLKDGSVVGSTGWVGADGYLRLQDYIADDQGYRIYKSKTVYVGLNRPIGESLKIAKTAPTDSGFGVTPAATQPQSRGHYRFRTTTSAPLAPSSYASSKYLPPEVSITPAPPRLYSGPTSTPQVVVSPNSIDSSTKFDFRPTVPPITASEAASASPSPYDYDSSNTNTIDDGYYASDSTNYRRYDLFNPNSYRHADDWLRRQQLRAGVRLGDGYTPQFPEYDGVAFRRNGFRYYLPKQYHEEVSGDSNDKTGSFGYIDPFGIRRVIYYNTSPDQGFQIRKNNRYVGHDATPYDPRPII